jgi:hypothetical protein
VADDYMAFAVSELQCRDLEYERACRPELALRCRLVGDELRRRARIESRRDKFLFANPVMREMHECGHEQHWVVFHVVGTYQGPRIGAADYWTACNLALTAAGASKDGAG